MLFSFALFVLVVNVAAPQQPSPTPPPMPPEIKAEMDRMAAIAQLAPEEKIKTEADARRLVDELAWSMGAEKPEAKLVFVRHVEEMKSLLARAEFAAVRGNRRLSEEKVAAAWNALMDEVGTPNWTRLTVAEVHYERDLLATISTLPGMHNPNLHATLFSRRPDGSFNPKCRPAEALYVLWMLQQSPGNFEALHKAAAEGVLPSEKMRRAREKQQRQGGLDKTAVRAELRASTDTAWTEYRQAWVRYFETHAFDRLPQRFLEIAREALGQR